MDIKQSVRKFALHNAIKYNGKANQGAVISHLIAELPEAKQNIKSIAREVADVIKQVNRLSIEQQRRELESISPEMLQEKPKEEKVLKELPNAVYGKVITRMAPEPSKYNHIGHALSFLLNYMYAKKYGGKCILRFEDTNPEKVTQEFVDAMNSDVIEYLDIKPDKVVYVSDHMDVMYRHAEELIANGDAYMCFCEQEKMRDLRHKGIECECRKKDAKTNLGEWKQMKDGKYKEGGCSLRIKADMKSQNHVMRDSVIFRVVDAPHYKHKGKYKAWPMYDFYNSIEDSTLGITHILRSNEFMLRGELQNYIKDLLKLQKQTIVEYGRFNVTGAVTQGREIRKLIESGEYLGWDDPRLVTLRALKRRGILKETFYALVQEIGITPAQTNIDFTLIAKINKRLLDRASNRYFFVQNPRKVKIRNATEKDALIPLHPDFRERGSRKLKTGSEFYIEDKLEKGRVYRLMHLFNFKDRNFISEDLDEKLNAKLIHWLPVSNDLVETEVMMPDAKVVKGLSEPDTLNVKVGDVIQFERFGFCRLDEKSNWKLTFWFAHK